MSEADVVRAALFPVTVAGIALIWRSRRHVVGRMLIFIGTVHLTGLWVGRSAVARIARGGFFNQADSAVGQILPRTDQELVFWFALWGIWTMMLGQLAILMQRRGSLLPAWFGWQLLVVNLTAAMLLPKGGFWWLLLPAGLIIRESGSNDPRRRETPLPSSRNYSYPG